MTALEKELPVLQKNNVRLNAIGNIGSLPEKANKKLISVINAIRQRWVNFDACIELRLTGRNGPSHPQGSLRGR